ncbi:MAG: CIA30 family protein [Flavobacteriales bacterium]
MKSIILFILGVTMVNVTSDNLKFDFGSGQNQISNWSVISDNVMGGVTKSKLEYTENSLILSRDISLAN